MSDAVVHRRPPAVSGEAQSRLPPVVPARPKSTSTGEGGSVGAMITLSGLRSP